MGSLIPCIKAPQFEGDVKRLRKKYRSVEADVRHVQRLLERGVPLPQTSQYPGFGKRKIFKTRVINTDLGNKGKSGGYRMIYEEVVKDNGMVAIILVMIYAKNEFQKEYQLKNEITQRLSSPSYPCV